MILDTTFLVDLIRKNQEIEKIIGRLDKEQDELFITTISVMELWFGAMQSHNKSKAIDGVKNLIENFNIYQFDLESAKRAGELNLYLKKIGKPIELEDVMIASIAKTNKEKILTRNIKHFQLIPNLEIESY